MVLKKWDEARRTDFFPLFLLERDESTRSGSAKNKRRQENSNQVIIDNFSQTDKSTMKNMEFCVKQLIYVCVIKLLS